MTDQVLCHLSNQVLGKVNQLLDKVNQVLGKVSLIKIKMAKLTEKSVSHSF